VRRLLTLAAAVGATAALLAPAPVVAAGQCRAIAHRMGPTPQIDDNTLAGLARSTAMGARSEVDLMPTADGLVAFHANRWEQGTTGKGKVWETAQSYARGLFTTRNGQSVPTAREVLLAADRQGSRLLIELHRWTHWEPGLLDNLVARVDRLRLWGQIWFTGTRGALAALGKRVNATVVWRLDSDHDLTLQSARDLDVDSLAVGLNISTATMGWWRQQGYPLSARQTTAARFGWAVDHDIWTVQTDRPGAWLRYCSGSSR
jgi:hypothetical protein